MPSCLLCLHSSLAHALTSPLAYQIPCAAASAPGTSTLSSLPGHSTEESRSDARATASDRAAEPYLVRRAHRPHTSPCTRPLPAVCPPAAARASCTLLCTQVWSRCPVPVWNVTSMMPVQRSAAICSLTQQNTMSTSLCAVGTTVPCVPALKLRPGGCKASHFCGVTIHAVVQPFRCRPADRVTRLVRPKAARRRDHQRHCAAMTARRPCVQASPLLPPDDWAPRVHAPPVAWTDIV